MKQVQSWLFRYFLSAYPTPYARPIRRLLGIRAPSLRDTRITSEHICEVCEQQSHGYYILVRDQRSTIPYTFLFDHLVRLWSEKHKHHFFRNREKHLPCCSNTCASSFVLWHYYIPCTFGQFIVNIWLFLLALPFAVILFTLFLCSFIILTLADFIMRFVPERKHHDRDAS